MLEKQTQPQRPLLSQRQSLRRSSRWVRCMRDTVGNLAFEHDMISRSRSLRA
ncbi:hypothetical protein CB0940_04791 [Cercospora beticola]|uniref:Uncharacterized protein n=1 Tax=Cercospora beticola TaxID=122368 RepID=A0A2G5HKS8_CERBT|nr:hypothetical protein CB0940_04791 [Cercospora beticola]PIA93125.1 hypothetical protein CB0940_04791 [Cercospora beticola]